LTHRPALGTLTVEVAEFRRLLGATVTATATGRLPLTPAELRLLPYLQTHLTASGIAEQLFVSSHTVKAEVKSIYPKLGVSSRPDAVQKATAIGLLGALPGRVSPTSRTRFPAPTGTSRLPGAARPPSGRTRPPARFLRA